MRKGAIAVACTAALLVLAVLPAGLRGMQAPGEGAISPEGGIVSSALDGGQPVSTAVGGADSPMREPSREARHTSSDEAFAPGVVLAGIADGVSLDQFNEGISQLGFIETRAVEPEDVLFGFVELSLAEGVDVDAAIACLDATDFARAAQPSFVYHACVDDGSAHGSQQLQIGALAQSELGEDGQKPQVDDPLAPQQWALDAIRAYDAWELARTDRTVTVAVLDSGVDASHEDLVGNLVGGYNVLDGSEDPVDEFGHGTHVAGIVSALVNNAAGVAGVSYNAQVMPVRIMNEKGDTDDVKALKGIRYVLDNAERYNVKVMNLSLGTSPISESDYQRYKDAYGQLLAGVSEAAREAGILVVCASGNYGANGPYYCFPSDFDDDDSMIGVINLRHDTVYRDGIPTTTYSRNANSNYNMADHVTKEISAPGTSILSTWPTALSAGSPYRRDTGTSMAAPCVSGVIALMYAANPDLEPDEAKAILYRTAIDIGEPGFDLETGYGMVDARAAVEEALGMAGDLVIPLSACTIEVAPDPLVYTGAALTPSVSVAYSGMPLFEGVDYTIRYEDNVNAGTARAVITGTGVRFRGEQAASFDVLPAPIEGADIALTPERLAYDGTAKEPVVSVVLGDAQLEQGRDFDVSFSDNIEIGTAIATVCAKGNYTGEASREFAIEEPIGQPVHRLYNGHSGEHFYTLDAQEREHLTALGWRDEGVGWIAPSIGTSPVYRLYNRFAGEHHYTLDALECNALVDAGWAFEGTCCFSYSAQTTPLYRAYNPRQFSCNHNYTTDQREQELLVSIGWVDEGTAWFGMPTM